MNKFEAVLLLSPELSVTSKSDSLNQFEDLLNQNDGKIINKEDWGLKDLSYSINNFSKSFYNFYQIEIDGKKIEGIKKNLNQKESFLRYLFIKVNNHQELPTKLDNEKK